MSTINAVGRDRNNIELALDRGVCYPMERVNLYIRVTMETPSRPLLCLHIPQNAEVELIHMADVDDNVLRVYSKPYAGRLLVIPLDKYLNMGASSEITVGIRLHTLSMNHYMSFCAWMAHEIPDERSDFFSS